MLTEAEYRDRAWSGIERPESLEGQLDAIHQAWVVTGIFCKAEIEQLYFDVVVFEGFELDRIPEPFREGVLEHLKGCAEMPEGEKLIKVIGGIYAYEVEPDPVKKAAMKAEVEADEAAESLFYEERVRPRIREWWENRGKS